ncbi:hypothetical protein [Streptomyces sp. NRRL S-350]|uniref:hypothetical protein n=1 Tax=Streptomyces sp. NRRL S-350 TaxID=1463902 RepID=UPI0004C23821|nr:hypothetical protein [Streptomyces sp. NRRL S-350]
MPAAMSRCPAARSVSIPCPGLPHAGALACLMPGDPSAHPEGHRLVLRDVGLHLTALSLIEANGSTSAADIVKAIGGQLPVKRVHAEPDALLEQDLLCARSPESAGECRTMPPEAAERNNRHKSIAAEPTHTGPAAPGRSRASPRHVGFHLRRHG